MSNERETEFSERAKHRLRIVARFLRNQGYKFNSGKFYEQVIGTIATLNADERDELKKRTDWIEAYETEEKANW